MRISSNNESTYQENKHSFHTKRRVVLWKVTCCFTSNNVSFWKSDVLFLFERCVVLLVVKHLGWRGKKGGRSACCDTCDSKKSKTLLGCARVYTRGKDTYSIFVFDTVLSEPKEGSPFASCKATKTSKSRLFMLFCKLCFSKLRLFAAKTSLFRHFFPLLCNISPYTNREMFRNLVMRGHTKTTKNCVNTNCRLNRMKRALLFQ